MAAGPHTTWQLTVLGLLKGQWSARAEDRTVGSCGASEACQDLGCFSASWETIEGFGQTSCNLCFGRIAHWCIEGGLGRSMVRGAAARGSRRVLDQVVEVERSGLIWGVL